MENIFLTFSYEYAYNFWCISIGIKGGRTGYVRCSVNFKAHLTFYEINERAQPSSSSQVYSTASRQTIC